MRIDTLGKPVSDLLALGSPNKSAMQLMHSQRDSTGRLYDLDLLGQVWIHLKIQSDGLSRITRNFLL